MDPRIKQSLPAFLDILGLKSSPMGMYYTDQEPDGGFSPSVSDLPTREKEKNNQVNWQAVFGNFSCVIQKIWLARKKNTCAYFSAEQFGCPGGAFWLGFNKPQTETIIHYVSSGIPGQMKGEHYCDSPEHLRNIFNYVDPEPARGKFIVYKPIPLFNDHQEPVLISFFARPESLCGLHQLAAFASNDPEIVVSPWSAACGSLAAWPLHYLKKGTPKAVLGGWDPSARKFYRINELSFTVPYQLFMKMLESYPDSFLKTDTWKSLSKRIHKNE